MLSLIRLSQPPTEAEKLLLASMRLLRSPHVIMPHRCRSTQEWVSHVGGHHRDLHLENDPAPRQKERVKNAHAK